MSEVVWIVLERLKIPKLVVLLLALAIVAFPRTADPIISDVIRARAAQITSLLDRAIPHRFTHVGRGGVAQQPAAAQ
jgi:hypothetical protein